MKLRRRESGAETELTPGLVVGRLAECGLQLQDGSVSRRHAKLELRGSSWWVVDLGSSNGTFRNGERGKEFELRGGDLVTCGFGFSDLARGQTLDRGGRRRRWQAACYGGQRTACHGRLCAHHHAARVPADPTPC